MKNIFFVDSDSRNDSPDGSIDRPFRTIGQAIEHSENSQRSVGNETTRALPATRHTGDVRIDHDHV